MSVVADQPESTTKIQLWVQKSSKNGEVNIPIVKLVTGHLGDEFTARGGGMFSATRYPQPYDLIAATKRAKLTRLMTFEHFSLVTVVILMLIFGYLWFLMVIN